MDEGSGTETFGNVSKFLKRGITNQERTNYGTVEETNEEIRKVDCDEKM